MSNGFQLLCSTTTVWIIDTLFQRVSRGIKNIFRYASTSVPGGGLFKQSAAAREAHFVSLLVIV